MLESVLVTLEGAPLGTQISFQKYYSVIHLVFDKLS